MSKRGVLMGLAIAVLLAGIAIWFGIESRRVSRDADRLAAESSTLVTKARARTEGVDLGNSALVDPTRTAEVIGAVRPALEKVLSYNYQDRGATDRAVTEHLTGKALCEHSKLFGEVRRIAPEQRLTLTSKVRDIGVTRLNRNQAALLVFVDQTTDRADNNQRTASGAQFGIQAEHQDGRWRITGFDMLNQPLPNGATAPAC